MSMCLLECCVLKSCPTFLHVTSERGLTTTSPRQLVRAAQQDMTQIDRIAGQACYCGQEMQVQHHTEEDRHRSRAAASVMTAICSHDSADTVHEAKAHPAQPSWTLLGTPDGLEPANLRPAVTPRRLGLLTSLRRVGRGGTVAGGARADIVGEEPLLADREQLFAVDGLGVRRHAVDPACDGSYIVLQFRIWHRLNAVQGLAVSHQLLLQAVTLQAFLLMQES